MLYAFDNDTILTEKSQCFVILPSVIFFVKRILIIGIVILHYTLTLSNLAVNILLSDVSALGDHTGNTFSDLVPLHRRLTVRLT